MTQVSFLSKFTDAKYTHDTCKFKNKMYSVLLLLAEGEILAKENIYLLSKPLLMSNKTGRKLTELIR